MFKQEDINQLLQEQLSSEYIKEYVNEKIRGVVKESIDEQFRSWGDNNYVFKAIQKSIHLNFKEMKLADFTAMYLETVNNSLSSIVKNDLQELITNNMKKLLVTDEPIVTLKKLVYSYIDSESSVEDTYKAYLEEHDYDGDWSGELNEDVIDFQDIWENEIFGLRLTKRSKYNWLEISLAPKDFNYSHQFDFSFTLHPIKDEEDMYECFSFHTRDIGNKEINIVSTNLRRFEKLAFGITKGITKIKISKTEIEEYFKERD